MQIHEGRRRKEGKQGLYGRKWEGAFLKEGADDLEEARSQEPGSLYSNGKGPWVILPQNHCLPIQTDWGLGAWWVAESEQRSRLSEKYEAEDPPQMQGCFLQKNVKI